MIITKKIHIKLEDTEIHHFNIDEHLQCWHSNSTLQLIINENPSTGYKWKLNHQEISANNSNLLYLKNDNFSLHLNTNNNSENNAENKVGASGYRTFTFGVQHSNLNPSMHLQKSVIIYTLEPAWLHNINKNISADKNIYNTLYIHYCIENKS